ncbi:hypothetical protein MXB_5110 [Myxobolus squamalis]|nr:hypothetical protein MXB_5110 [Myxobolus squamalis]
MVFLDPYLHSTLNCLEYNLKPLIPIKLNLFLEQTNKFISHRGIDYNLMIIGRSGSGKSSLLDTIFNCAVSRKHNDMQIMDAPQLPESCIVRSVRHIIEENDLRIRLCIYDTPGYGDLIDNTNCILPITTKIKDLYNMHMRKEESIERDPSNLDDRIHCCLYTRIKADLIEQKINCYPFTVLPSGPKSLNAESNIEQIAQTYVESHSND